jgi:hypothetical protein
MKIMKNYLIKVTLSLIFGFLVLKPVTAQTYHWQVPNAKVIATGDLQWEPQPFKYPVLPGEIVRYIDYENGDDNNDGETKNTAWKHHPWDTRATDKAKACEGIKSYVFKRGVYYRIYRDGPEAFLKARNSGNPGTPVRLTSDPNWGEGEAVIAGSKRILENWKKATAGDVPKRMNAENIWFIDISLPRSPQNQVPPSVRQNFHVPGVGQTMSEMILYEVSPDGDITDLHIASDAGWNMTNPNFAMHHWNQWDGEKNMNAGNGEEDIQGYDEALKGFEPDYFEGGTLWSQYGWIIGTPIPYIIKPGDYDPEKGILAHRNLAHPTHKGTRYLIENLPQFLDKPGEYYYDEDYSDNSGRLFLRLPNDRNPNNSRIEMATAWNSLLIHNQQHIEISGITFRFNGRNGAVIDIADNSSHITIKNCKFGHMASDAIYGRVLADEAMKDMMVSDCDFYHIHGGTAICFQGHSGNFKPGEKLGILDDIFVLRNRIRNTGIYRHNDSRWSNVPAIVVNYCRKAEIAGNIIHTSFGSGIVAQGGKSGKDEQGYDIPLIRIFVHHNKIEYTALGVNDYGGLSLWQHGPMYSYSNIVGNAVGHWPGGFGGHGSINLSYPVYLDAGYRIFNFNNISWARPYDDNDPYTSDRSAYFNVFGYLNPFVNNTVYGSGVALGGTSGNRNDYLGNIFTNITQKFISVNHGGNPSLIGGDDPGTSGIDGATTLAYGHNLFYGNTDAGTVATIKQGAKKNIDAGDFDLLKQQMKDYPLRFAQVGEKVLKQPLTRPLPDTINPDASQADFRPAVGSAAIDNGIEYFVPWALYATIGEWHFNENHSNPELILDYHHYPTPVYFDRSMYYKVPVFELEINSATQDDYIYSSSETWAKGALYFDGKRYAKVPDASMKADILININSWSKGKKRKMPMEPWIVPEPNERDEKGNAIFSDEQFFTFPGEYRKTPDMDVNNFLLETIFKTDKNHAGGGIIGKHNGNTGYKLFITKNGYPSFVVSANGKNYQLVGNKTINDGEWHHVIAEIDRATGKMTLYIDGKLSGESVCSLKPSVSLSNEADLYVGRDNEGKKYLLGAIDFMRISRGTLADAETDINELYEWQFNGPVKYDFAGNAPEGKRDIGAMERIKD